MAIVLNDLLKISDNDLSRTKIRFNLNNGKENPIDVYKTNPNDLLEWNYWNNNKVKYRKNDISIGLVRIDPDPDRWLFFTVGTISGSKSIPVDTGEGWEYVTKTQYNDLYGRVIVKYQKQQGEQGSVRNAINKNGRFIDKLIVSEILPSIYNGFDFPGYDKVCLSYKELETIVKGNYPSYKNALSNQKAVYVQTDKKTGKLYIGSATSKDGMLFDRWKDYVKDGHGGNQGLKELVNKETLDYIKENFQYTILENFNSKVDDAYVLEREQYWKAVFCSKQHGYNKN